MRFPLATAKKKNENRKRARNKESILFYESSSVSMPWMQNPKRFILNGKTIRTQLSSTEKMRKRRLGFLRWINFFKWFPLRVRIFGCAIWYTYCILKCMMFDRQLTCNFSFLFGTKERSFILLLTEHLFPFSSIHCPQFLLLLFLLLLILLLSIFFFAPLSLYDWLRMPMNQVYNACTWMLKWGGVVQLWKRIVLFFISSHLITSMLCYHLPV